MEIIKKIQNIYINVNSGYQGLFGYNGGIIYNTEIDGIIIDTGNNYGVGGIVGSMESRKYKAML